MSSDKNLPLKWSDKENVRWRVALPGPGNSSPIVWANRVFVTQAVEKEKVSRFRARRDCWNVLPAAVHGEQYRLAGDIVIP